jgi:hypothetical protein
MLETFFHERILGKVFTTISLYSSPSVVQVIGWTLNSVNLKCKKRRVYVREVNINMEHFPQKYDDKGVCFIDKNDMYLVNSSNVQYQGLDSMFIFKLYITEDDEVYLTKSGFHDSLFKKFFYIKENLDNPFTWIPYPYILYKKQEEECHTT